MESLEKEWKKMEWGKAGKTVDGDEVRVAVAMVTAGEDKDLN